MAVVVDDTSTVWNDHEENLLAVERYVWFPSSRRQFGLRGKSLLELNRWDRQSFPLFQGVLERTAKLVTLALHVMFTKNRVWRIAERVLRHGRRGRYALASCMHGLDWRGAPMLLRSACTAESVSDYLRPKL